MKILDTSNYESKRILSVFIVLLGYCLIDVNSTLLYSNDLASLYVKCTKVQNISLINVINF